jgi:hypothetical protein
MKMLESEFSIAVTDIESVVYRFVLPLPENDEWDDFSYEDKVKFFKEILLEGQDDKIVKLLDFIESASDK